MKTRVLISGGAGFIGSHTADLLLKKGYQVRILDNLSSKTHNTNWPEYLDPQIEKQKGDVRNKADWEIALKDVSFVIHLAAWMDLLPEPEKFFSVNVGGTANLYDVILKHKFPIKKIVVASSQFVYGQGRWNCPTHKIVFPSDRSQQDLDQRIWDPRCPKCHSKIAPLLNTEDHADPPNPYAISKYTQELMAIKLGKLYSIPSTALRYSIVHGSRQSIKNAYSGALRVFTAQLIAKQPPSIFEDGLQLRDFVSVKDVAAANVLAIESEKTDYAAFNVGGKKAFTIAKLAKIIARQLNSKTGFTPNGQYRQGDIRHAVSDISKLKKLGWKPAHTEEESIKDFIDWFKSQPTNTRITKANSKMEQIGILRST